MRAVPGALRSFFGLRDSQPLTSSRGLLKRREKGGRRAGNKVKSINRDSLRHISHKSAAPRRPEPLTSPFSDQRYHSPRISKLTELSTALGGEGCGGERGRRRWRRLWRPRKRWCRRRRPVVSASSSSLPNTCAADSFISAQLNWPAAVVRAWMPRCAPAACRHRAACPCGFAFGHSSLRDLRVLKEGRVSGRLLCGRFGPGQGCWGGGSRP